MTYLSNIDLLNAEFDYRTEQLKSGLAVRRSLRTASRRTGLARLRRGGASDRPRGEAAA